MRIAIGSIVQESNDFSPVRTRYGDFDFVFGADAVERHRSTFTEMGGFLNVLGKTSHKIAPLSAGWAVTAGPVERRDFSRVLSEFQKSLTRVRRPDAVLLALHGGQTAETVPDVAGHLLAAARSIVGPKTAIVATLDLHANVTRLMVQSATALVGYKTYPHMDLFQTGQRAAELLLRTLSGTVRPRMAFYKLPLIVPAENMQTTSGPFARLMDEAIRIEDQREAEVVSVFGVQPWLDVPEMGCSVVSVTDNDPEQGRRQVEKLARGFWESRREFAVKLTPVRRAILESLRADEGPIVISEPADSTGSGSPGDSTGLLKPLLQLGRYVSAALFIVDPDVVKKAIAAGVGATIHTSVGGKFDPEHSRPVRIAARVRLISDGRWTWQAPGYNQGVETSMGRAVVLDIGQMRLLVAERPTMTVDPELYRSHGIEPARMRIVAVKSPNGFRGPYQSLAKQVFLVDTPGVSTPQLKTLPYRRVPRPIYPLDPRLRIQWPNS
jgi:microcystin degradation protein MlrC